MRALGSGLLRARPARCRLSLEGVREQCNTLVAFSAPAQHAKQLRTSATLHAFHGSWPAVCGRMLKAEQLSQAECVLTLSAPTCSMSSWATRLSVVDGLATCRISQGDVSTGSLWRCQRQTTVVCVHCQRATDPHHACGCAGMRSWGALTSGCPSCALACLVATFSEHTHAQTAANSSRKSTKQLSTTQGSSRHSNTMCAGLASSGACSLKRPADACLPLVGALTAAWWLSTCPHSTQEGKQSKERHVQTGSSSRAGAAAAAGPTCFVRIRRSRMGVAARLCLGTSCWQAAVLTCVASAAAAARATAFATCPIAPPFWPFSRATRVLLLAIMGQAGFFCSSAGCC